MRCLASVMTALLAADCLCAEVPALAKAIDQAIQKRLDQEKIPASPRAADAEFLRRVYLDLTGRIPTYDQAVAFLDSDSANKRAELIDELLARREFGWHLANHWRELIVDRGAENIGQARENSWAFITWLEAGINSERGWDQIVRDILTAEGEVKTNPAGTFILANRMGVFPKPEEMTGMTGRLFMGINLRCAQCHDHPYVETWTQDDFWGVAAFFSQVRDHNLGGDNSARAPMYFEKAMEDPKKLKSYAGAQKRNGIIPAEPGPQIAVPKGSDPNATLKMVKAKFFLDKEPKLAVEGPYRKALADWLTAKDNPYFARATVNRLWAHFFARGLIPALDDARPDQPASHPELLALLEKEFKAGGFQLKPIVRALCNSDAYQRTSKPLAGNAQDQTLFSRQSLRLLTSDQVIDALAIAMGRNPTEGKNRDQQTAPFATSKADGDPKEFSHGVQQTLLLMNGGITGQTPNNFGKLTVGKSKEVAITNLYLAVLSRRPRSEELERALTYVQDAPPNEGTRDVFWALVNSAEFIFNR